MRNNIETHKIQASRLYWTSSLQIISLCFKSSLNQGFIPRLSQLSVYTYILHIGNIKAGIHRGLKKGLPPETWVIAESHLMVLLLKKKLWWPFKAICALKTRIISFSLWLLWLFVCFFVYLRSMKGVYCEQGAAGSLVQSNKACVMTGSQVARVMRRKRKRVWETEVVCITFLYDRPPKFPYMNHLNW